MNPKPTVIYPVLICILFLFSCTEKQDTPERPNILLIMADDMGYSDIGCYGSQRIRTPVLDSLANGGLRFARFYNGAKCCPTRASLLTGLYPHEAGVGGMAALHDTPPPVRPGPFQGYLNDSCLTIAEVLKLAGYNTMMSGKWHVGEESKHWPTERGFDRYFGLISGAANYFDISRTKWEGVVRKMALDDSPWIPPRQGFYMTDAISDYAVRFLREQEGSMDPFFLYVAFTAPHWPLHAMPEDIEKYKGEFSVGWDSLRAERYLTLQESGLISRNTFLSPRDPDVPPWSEIENKEEMALRMEVYAAQIDRMDQGIGRIVSQLRDIGKAENTIIMFLSDNGPSAQGGVGGLDYWENGAPCGGVDSYMSYGKGWANVSATPFRLFKGNIHEGGICSPFIAYWPDIIGEGRITGYPGHIIDLMQTCCELAVVDYPDTFQGKYITHSSGKSLVPLFRGKTVKEPEYLFWEHFGRKGLRKGNWKLVADYSQPWELYDLEADGSELRDISQVNRDSIIRLDSVYEAWAHNAGVYSYPGRDSVYRALYQ